jgi:sodium-dependent dicarboxylate transporter 2/3/5
MNTIIAEIARRYKGRRHLLQRWACILVSVLILVALLHVPLPEARDGSGELVPLSQSGRTCMAILALCLVLWTTEAVPFAATGLAVFLLFPAFGVATATEVAGRGLGHPLILFFLSLFLLSSAFMQVGLSHRVSRWVLLRSRGRPSRVILFTLALGALLTLGITALATASVLLSVVLEILERTHLRSKRGNFGRALLIASSWGPLIGSVGTPAGAGSNPLTMGYLKELAGIDVTFVQWMTLGVPTVLFLVPVAWVILRWAFPGEDGTLLSEVELAALEAEGHSPLTRREKAFLLVLGITLILWIATPAIEQLSGGRVALTLQGVGLAAALVLFLPGLDLLSWTRAERDTPWGALLVLAGGLAAGVMLYDSGAARWLAWLLMGPLGNVAPAPRVFVIVATIALLRLIFSSSTAAAAILVPLVIALAQDLGADPWLFTAPAAFAVSIGFILPVQAGVHLVSYSAGHFSGRDMARAGVVFTLVAVLVMAGVMLLTGRLTGLYRF